MTERKCLYGSRSANTAAYCHYHHKALTPKQLKAIEQAQAEILDIAAKHLSDKGRIVYMTCSVLPEENEERIEQFCKNIRILKR